MKKLNKIEWNDMRSTVVGLCYLPMVSCDFCFCSLLGHGERSKELYGFKLDIIGIAVVGGVMMVLLKTGVGRQPRQSALLEDEHPLDIIAV